jgi:phenylacetate-CoA ligase
MTTATMTDLDLLRARASGAMGRLMPAAIGRLGWDSGQLAACQRDRLRALLARAIASSPFHAARLRGVDPDRFELADLGRLPVMTKADMMENFDAATTDRRLSRHLVERHLARAVTDPALLLGEYVVLVSGGSSGQRGLFVQTADEYAELAASVTRRALAATIASGLPPEGPVIGMVELAREQRDGRLRLSLRSVASFAEAISRPERIAVTEAFGVPVIDTFASTEGLVGHSEPGATVLTFASDTCLAECVDDEGRPVPDGVASAESGADIVAVIDGDFDQAAVAAAVEQSLRQAGLARPQVGFRRVGALDRDPMTSKVRRFVPLPAGYGPA